MEAFPFSILKLTQHLITFLWKKIDGTEPIKHLSLLWDRFSPANRGRHYRWDVFLGWEHISRSRVNDAPPVVTLPMIGAAPARTHTTISAQSPAPTSRRTGGILAAILGGSSCAILAAALFLILLALIIIGVAIYYWGTGSWAAWLCFLVTL